MDGPKISPNRRETRDGGRVVDKDMRKLCLVLLALALLAWAANVKLYLTDGTYHLVREYQVLSDRVRFYTVERGEWEEVPLDMVDLKRTRAEVADREETVKNEEKVIGEENAAEAEVRKEASKIPQGVGVYWIDGTQTKSLKLGDVAVHSNKGRMVLQKLSPVPAITGKATLEMTGAHSETIFTDPEPEFFIQLEGTESFGIVKLTPKGNIRIVENITYHPLDKDLLYEERASIDYLHRQLDDGLYKLWPKDPLPPGEYAVVMFTDGKVDIQSYDFAIKAK
jgi:hypothetical protein